MTVAPPLSAGLITIEVSSLRSLKASISSSVKFFRGVLIFSCSTLLTILPAKQSKNKSFPG